VVFVGFVASFGCCVVDEEMEVEVAELGDVDGAADAKYSTPHIISDLITLKGCISVNL